MKQEKAPVTVNNSIKLESIPFSQIPGQSRLFLDYQSDVEKIDSFYTEKHTPLKQFAQKVLKHYKIDRNRLCDILLEENKKLDGNIKTFINIEKLRQKDCLAVVTGQQTGLFTGPLYTIYKALSAVKLASELRSQNIKAVPVFWLAEEDHDFAEVNHTFVIDKEGKLTNLEYSPKSYREDTPVAFAEIDGEVEKKIEGLFEMLPKTEFSSSIKELLENTYKKGETYSTAFAKLLAKILKDYGVIFVPPLNKDLKKLCSPIFADSIEYSEEIVSELLEKNKKLEAVNYHLQVLVEDDSFPFFVQNENNERLALRRNLENGNIYIQRTENEIKKKELKKIAERYPQFLSPNALLRPVVQDYLLPTVTYFGGGAEIAYFAQNAAIYEILDRPVTPILHRSSFTIISGRQRRNLKNYNLNFLDLFDGTENIFARIVEEFLANDVALTFADVEETINKQLHRLEKSLIETEPTLADNAANRQKKIMWHISALRKKYHRAEIIKDEVAQRRINGLFAELLPNKSLQERTLNVVMYLNLYGFNFIEWLYEAIDSEEKGHQGMIF